MIIKNADAAEPAGPSSFHAVDVLKLSSAELLDRHGLRVSEFGMTDRADVIAALAGFLDGPPLRAAADLLDVLDLPSPCYLGWQEVNGVATHPFLSDGTAARWSAFFDDEGRATLVERSGDELQLTDCDKMAPVAGTVPGRAQDVLAAIRRRIPWKGLARRTTNEGQVPPGDIKQPAAPPAAISRT